MGGWFNGPTTVQKMRDDVPHIWNDLDQAVGYARSQGVSEAMMRWMVTGMEPSKTEKQLAGDDLKNKAREGLLAQLSR